MTADLAAQTVEDVVSAALAGGLGADPGEVVARSVFFLTHGTRLAASPQLFRTSYALVRVEDGFGACGLETTDVDAGVHGPDLAAWSGRTVAELLRDAPTPVRIAALDAWLAALAPHRDDPRGRRVRLPAGTPDVRAVARDEAVADLVGIEPGDRVGLIGVVNPLVAAIRERGGEPLPCDFNLTETHWGDPVTSDMTEVLESADKLLVTGMTVANGSFDTIRRRCLERGVDLVVYAQSGAAIARHWWGHGVTAISAETFPFSQCSADETDLVAYERGRSGV